MACLSAAARSQNIAQGLAAVRRFCALPDDQLTPWQLSVKRQRETEEARMAALVNWEEIFK